MTNTPDQPIVPDNAELLRLIEDLEERLSDLEYEHDWDPEHAPEDDELVVSRIHCNTLIVGDGSCRFPIGIQQKDGESFICMPSGMSGGMVLIGGDTAGGCMVVGTDPEGVVRWALGYDSATGCVLPKEDLRLMGEEGPLWEFRRHVQEGIAEALGAVEESGGMAGLTT